MSSPHGVGSGSRLPPQVLLSASLSAGFATIMSIWCIIRQLKHYRKPLLQRFVVRILIMVPIYSLSSLVSLYSLDAAYFIDAVRDVYEAFVIYCFFSLLIEYLGGERSLIILLHGRSPTPHPWPFNRLFAPMDISDPYTFLALKRGILQYVQVKPVLAVLTMLFKATGIYRDGDLRGDSGYTYVSVAYNLSVSLSLYCLAMFWMCTNADLQAFRPMPKFLCVKGIIFFSFWQGFMISVLVAAGALGSASYDSETLSIAVQDTLICFEMPLFAILHLYAFSHKDYEDPGLQYSGRLPFYWAFRDSIFGFKDVLEDSLTTLRGTGFSYRTFEPAEGALHRGPARERRVRAGLRYAQGGKAKYWLPMPGETEAEAYGRRTAGEGDDGSVAAKGWRRPFSEAKKAWTNRRYEELGYAPITPEQANDVVHRDPRELEAAEAAGANGGVLKGRWDLGSRIGMSAELAGVTGGEEYDSGEGGSDLAFGEREGKGDDELYKDARRLEFGDYNNPVVDASKEAARRIMREHEEGVLSGRQRSSKRGARKQKMRSLLHTDTPPSSPERKERQKPNSAMENTASASTSGAAARANKVNRNKKFKGKGKAGELPEGCIDLLVEDKNAEQDKAAQERLKGEANLRGDVPRKVFRRVHPELAPPPESATSRSASQELEAGGKNVKRVSVESPPPDPGELEVVDETVPASLSGPSAAERPLPRTRDGQPERSGAGAGLAVEVDRPQWAQVPREPAGETKSSRRGSRGGGATDREGPGRFRYDDEGNNPWD